MISKEKRQIIAHIWAGLIILLHGYEKMEKGESTYLFFYVAGFIFLLIALFHHQLVKKLRWIDGVFHAIEAFVMLVIAYEYFHQGKKGLPMAYLVAGICYLIAAIVISRRRLKALLSP